MPLSPCVKVTLALLTIAFVLYEPMFKSSLVSLTAFAESGNNEKSTDGVPLPAPGASTVGEIAAGETNAYVITLKSGQYVSMLIERRDLDISLALYDPNGAVLFEVECRRSSLTPVFLIAESSGVYRLAVRPLEKEQVRGHYELHVEENRPGNAVDSYRIAAQKVVVDGQQLQREWKEESSFSAISKFKDSLHLWRAAGDRRAEAYTLRRVGDVYQPLGDYEQALVYYDQALSLSRKIHDRRSEGETLNEICYAYLNTGQNEKALRLCNQALRINQATENRRGIAQSLNNLGEISYGSGQNQQSLAFFQKALPAWSEAGDRQGSALTLLNIGYTYSDLGQMREALNNYNQALSLWMVSPDKRGQAMTLTAIGRLHSRMGESQVALDYFEKAMQLIEPLGARAEQGRILTGLAYVYDQLGDKQKAIESYNLALPLFHATGDYGEAMAIYDAAKVFFSLGDYQKALEYHEQALALSTAARDRHLQAFEIREIGRIYDVRGDKSRALDYYLKALSFLRAEKTFRGEAETLNLIGNINEERGRTQDAFEYYNQALLLSRKAEYPVGEIATLYRIAHLERDRGNFTIARQKTQRALELVESLRSKVISEDLRTSYFATVRQHYELYIDVLMHLQKQDGDARFDAEAFEISERARARSLLESLNAGRADIREGVDRALLLRQRSLQQSLEIKAERRSQLLAARQNTEAQALGKEIDQITTEYDETTSQIRSKNPRYAALIEPQPLSLSQIQQQVLDNDTLLLEYMLGDERSYVWAVTRTEVSSYVLPPQRNIAAVVKKAYELLRSPPGTNSANEFSLAAQELSQIVLSPIAAHLNKHRVIVVADGALNYIPFQILPAPNANQEPLVAGYEVINAPSASILGELRQEAARRQPAAKILAAFGDPVFASNYAQRKDRNFGGQIASKPTLENESGRRGSRDVEVDRDSFDPSVVQPLFYARRELSVISEVAGKETFLAADFDATRERLQQADLTVFAILHFATHGILDPKQPENSGLLLSTVNRSGQAQNGFVGLQDIYNLHVPVNLVVLSACRTGLGKDVRGEGLIGLTRGFMYAGASSVVASLWKVDDEATSELMKRFYSNMLQQGMTPAAALRAAQNSIRHEPQWSSPYYWAAFTLQGDYHQAIKATSPAAGSTRQLIFIGVVLLILLPLLYRSHRRMRSALEM
jgi:CHAT domain-containing protein/tetratricopeptide (TPR) repeat protein